MAAHGIGRKTKIKLFKTLVRQVLLYVCETWKLNKMDEKKLNRFQCQCLRRLLRIEWWDKISNIKIEEKAELSNISNEI